MIVDKVKNPLFLDPSAPCAGCASAVEVDQEIVSFALAELSYGECQLNSVRVENFKQQVTVVVLCSGDISIMLLRWWPASSTASTW